MALYGDNLGKTIRPGTTWLQGTDVLGALEDAERACYASLDLWNNWKTSGTADTVNLAILSAISPDDSANMRKFLDDDYAHLLAMDTLVQERLAEQGADQPMADDYLANLQAAAAYSSKLIATCDSLFHTSVASQAADAIVPVVGNIGDQIGNGLSKLVGNFLAGIWWIIALGLLGLWVWHKWLHKAVT